MLGGCGYTTGSPFRQDVRSVDVPIWTVGKDVYRRGLEDRITQAVKKRLAATPYKIATAGTADTQLTGNVELISQRILSSNPDTGLPREIEITLTVSFKWIDLRNGNVLADQPAFQVSDTYIPDRGFREDFFLGSEGAINKLARRVVEKMEYAW